MRQRVARWLSLLTVCFMLAAFCSTAGAALLDVGPADLPSPPGHGFSAWYRDLNRVPLEPCLSLTQLPGGGACILLADPGDVYNPALPAVYPTNFPSEMFYFIADATINVPAGVIKYRAALEGAFGTSVAVGDRITFARIRISADLPAAGTYKFTHPYGVETLVADAPGKRAIVMTRDIGIGAFTGALTGDLGPWLIASGFPQSVGTETFIGDPNVPSTVTGSPLGTNLFRVDAPAGVNLDGAGGTRVTTNLFTVAGKVSTSGLGTPLTVDRATYTRDAINAQVEVFATTQPIANVTTGLPPNPFALLGIPSALEFADVTATVPRTVMTTNNLPDGKFFAASASFPTPATMPGIIRVTNTADIPPTSVDVPLVDEVVITETSFDPATKVLKVAAYTGDKVDLPALTVVMLDGQLEVPLGSIDGITGQLSVPFPVTKTLPAPNGTKTYNIPPESVTVRSANGGSATDVVTSPQNTLPVAVNDAARVLPGGSVVINVAVNDTAGGAVVPTTVSIVGAGVTPPTKGTLFNNGDGTITYTNTAGTGTDTFTYTIQGPTGTVSNFAAVTVTINRPPVANNDAFTTNEDTQAIFNVILNDTDADAPVNAIAPATVLVTVQPLHGTAAALVDGTVRYTPSLNYNGADSFQYTVRDTFGADSAGAATVSITVNPVADPPLTVNDTATTPGNTPATIDVLVNDSHPDLPALAIAPATLAIATNPVKGTAAVVAGKVLYTPTLNSFGTDSFTYIVSDTAVPARVSAAATVTVTVTPVNIPPVAANDVSSTFVNIARTINVIANDTDADGTINPASVVIAGPAAVNGSAVANPDGTVTFTPTAGVAGVNGTFSYSVTDNAGAVSNNALVTVSIQSAATDSVSVLKAQYTASKLEWLVQGSATNAAPGTVVRLHVGSDPTGQVIGTTTIAADLRWRFQSTTTGVAPDANRTISVALPSGSSRLAFPVAVR